MPIKFTHQRPKPPRTLEDMLKYVPGLSDKLDAFETLLRYSGLILRPEGRRVWAEKLADHPRVKADAFHGALKMLPQRPVPRYLGLGDNEPPDPEFQEADRIWCKGHRIGVERAFQAACCAAGYPLEPICEEPHAEPPTYWERLLDDADLD